MTITINANITLTASTATCKAVQDDLNAYAARLARKAARKQWKAETDQVLADLRSRRDPADWNFYSDLFKDRYGIRPHWGWDW